MAEARGKSILSKSSVHGEGTRVAEYIETPITKQCGTCEYLVDENLCKNKVVRKDDQIKTDAETGLKIIDPVLGCCRFWEQSDEDDD